MLFGKDLYTQIPLTEATPPALPSLSPQVWQAAFVHSSKNIDQIARSKFRYAEDFADNERLEWVGDALLYSIVANYLFRTYPKLRVSYLSAIRQRMVQNATLAKFARLYKMDQALILGEGAERYRNDLKTLADTFEAFVGAVHQVHGLALTTKWIEDLIRPYATELYEHYARMYGEETRLGEDNIGNETSPAPSSSASSERRWRRFCGFIPLPFFWSSPETKSIAAGSSGSEQNYGTLVTVSQVASNQGYTKLPQETASSFSGRPNGTTAGPQTPAMKKGKSQDTPLAQNAAALSSAATAAVKRSKSKDRVAFTPPSVSNMESLKSAQKKARQAGSNSLSDGELPRTVPGLPKQQQTPKQVRTAPVEEIKAKSKASDSERSAPVIFPVTGSKTLAAATSSAGPSTVNGWTLPQTKQADTPSGAPAWGADKNVTFAPAVTTPNVKPSNAPIPAPAAPATPSEQKAILRRPSGTPVGQAPTNGAAKSFSQAQPQPAAERSQAVTKYLDALTLARSDPVAYLEGHHLFNVEKNRKARALDYDDSTSTPKKCIVQVKVDGRIVSESAAAALDTKLAKARAAFKAIDALSLLPDPPKELTDNGGIVKPTELAIPSNTVWLPDLKKPITSNSSGREGTITAAETPAADSTIRQTDDSSLVAVSNGVQIKKQVEMIANPPGPFPGTIYASLPTGGKGSSTRYYITSVKGFGGGTYHAILDGDLALIGQAASTKKASAIEEAERMAKANAASGRKLSSTTWAFVDCSRTGKLAKKANIMPHAKANTGVVPLLTHATAVEANEKARVIWLEWYAEDKKAWKCVAFADAIFFGSGKNADRKAALTAASAKALEELEKV